MIQESSEVTLTQQRCTSSLLDKRDRAIYEIAYSKKCYFRDVLGTTLRVGRPDYRGIRPKSGLPLMIQLLAYGTILVVGGRINMLHIMTFG